MIQIMRMVFYKILYFATGFLISIYLSTSYSKPIELSYKVNKFSEHSILVELTFIGTSSGETIIMLPNEWAGNSELYNNVYDLKIIKPVDAKIITIEKPENKKIQHKPNEKIILEYKLKQGFKGKPTETNQALTPIIQQDYFQLIGNGFLISPEYDNETKIIVSFDWKLPKNWKIANSYGVNKKIQKKLNTTIGDLFHSIFLAGDLEIIPNNIGKNKLWLAFKKDNWENISSRMIMDASNKIIQAQRIFWSDHNQEYFLISVIPVGTSMNSFQGTGLNNSFALFLPTGITFDTGMGLLTMISHEYFHTWNHPRIFNIDNARNDAKIAWFTEGFTDYYANRILLATGLITLDKYVNDYNTALINYYSSPVRHYTNEDVGKDYWNNYDVSKLPYLQGNILAHNWNIAIKHSTNYRKYFDDFIREIIIPKESQASDDQLISVEKIIQISKKYLPLGIEDDINSYIKKGQLIKPHPNSLGPCCKLVIKKTAKYKNGFPIKNDLKKGIISYVHKGSEAEKAGLRKGYKIISADFDEDNILKPIIVKIHDGNKYQTISYMPYSKGELKSIPQFVLDQNKFSSDPLSCLEWFY